MLRRKPLELSTVRHEETVHWREAIMRGSVGAVRDLIVHGANVDSKSLDGEGTPLHFAVKNRKPEITRYLLLDCNAEVNLVDCHFDSPIETAAQRNDAELLGMLIARRSSFAPSLFDHILTASCSRYLRSHQNPAILAHYVSRLTAANISALVREDEGRARLKYLAHLESLQGRMRDGTSLEGWLGEKFLPLRIYVYFTVLVKLTINAFDDRELTGLAPADLIEERKNLRAKLQRELLLEVETLRTLYDILAIKGLHDHGEQSDVQKICARRIAGNICLAPQFCFYYSSGGHVIYLNFTRVNGELIRIRIDNLGLKSERHPHGSKAGFIQPYVRNVPAAVFAEDGPGVSYIENLLANFGKAGTEGLDKIYAMDRLHPSEVVWDGGEFKLQEVGNCVVHNHQMGVTIRLGEAISAWLVNQELATIIPRDCASKLAKGEDRRLWGYVSDEEKIVSLIKYGRKFDLGREIALKESKYAELKSFLEKHTPHTWEIACPTTSLPQISLRTTMFLEQKHVFDDLVQQKIIKFKYTETGIPDEFEIAICEWDMKRLQEYFVEHKSSSRHSP